MLVLIIVYACNQGVPVAWVLHSEESGATFTKIFDAVADKCGMCLLGITAFSRKLAVDAALPVYLHEMSYPGSDFLPAVLLIDCSDKEISGFNSCKWKQVRCY